MTSKEGNKRNDEVKKQMKDRGRMSGEGGNANRERRKLKFVKLCR